MAFGSEKTISDFDKENLQIQKYGSRTFFIWTQIDG